LPDDAISIFLVEYPKYEYLGVSQITPTISISFQEYLTHAKYSLSVQSPGNLDPKYNYLNEPESKNHSVKDTPSINLPHEPDNHEHELLESENNSHESHDHTENITPDLTVLSISYKKNIYLAYIFPDTMISQSNHNENPNHSPT